MIYSGKNTAAEKNVEIRWFMILAKFENWNASQLFEILMGTEVQNKKNDPDIAGPSMVSNDQKAGMHLKFRTLPKSWIALNFGEFHSRPPVSTIPACWRTPTSHRRTRGRSRHWSGPSCPRAPASSRASAASSPSRMRPPCSDARWGPGPSSSTPPSPSPTMTPWRTGATSPPGGPSRYGVDLAKVPVIKKSKIILKKSTVSQKWKMFYVLYSQTEY